MSVQPAPDASPPIRITDRDDPRIAVFRDVKERDLIGRDGIFIAEGLSVLTVLLTRSPLQRLAILVEEGRAARLPVLSTRGTTPLYVAPQRVIDAIAGFDLHRGILAAGRVPQSHPLTALPERGSLRLLVALALANHDNVGGLYRNAAAFGAWAVAVDGRSADPFYRKAIRVGVGAPLVVPTVRYPALPQLIADLHHRGVTAYALTPRAGSVLGRVELAPRAAFLLGAEGSGLPDEARDLAEPLSVAITGSLDSLNVATAAAIALHDHALTHGLC